MADFPTNVASDGSLLIAANNVASTLDGGISAIATSMTLASTVNFPSAGGCTIENEAILWSANNTGTSVLSGLTRGAGSTTAAVHAGGVAVRMYVQADYHNRLKDEIKAIETMLGSSSQDITKTGAGKGLVVTTPDGLHTYRMAVDNDGNLTTEQIT